jgi:3D (Asp-Asp-Asp) domain-containing protein
MTLTNVLVTAYCACSTCCGPTASGLTAAGTRIRPGVIAAPRSVPFYTRVRIEGVGSFVVLDRTARRFDGRWDVYIPSHTNAKKFGKRYLNITINTKP